MVAQVRPDYPSDWPAICAVAEKLGIGTAETLRKWVRQAEVDARSRESFDLLMAAAGHLSREAGCTSFFTWTSGSSWATRDALAARGYRAGGAMVRMKCGENTDYDRTATYYCDNWL